MIYKNSIDKFVNEIKKQYDTKYLKEQFKNVKFIIGTAYAGKSTMIKMLSEKYNGIMCGENFSGEFFSEYGASLETHPNLCYTDTHSMDEFVNRSPEEYYNWLRGCEMEATPIEIWHILRLTEEYPNKYIFVDTSIPMEVLKEITDYNNIIVMLSDQSMSVDRFFDRSDYEKNIIFRAIKNSQDPDATMKNYREILIKNNGIERYNYFLNSGLFVFKRNDSYSLKQTMDILAKQFNLKFDLCNDEPDCSHKKGM